MKIQLPVILIACATLGAAGGAALRFFTSELIDEVEPAVMAVDAKGAEEALSSSEASYDPGETSLAEDKKEKRGYGKKGEQATYFKFSRQFVAPIVESGRPKATMILDVMIELAPEASEAIYADEPKLRDAVLKALLSQSANGALSEMLVNPELLEATRHAVLDQVKNVIGEDAKSVLLMDVGYQPY